MFLRSNANPKKVRDPENVEFRALLCIIEIVLATLGSDDFLRMKGTLVGLLVLTSPVQPWDGQLAVDLGPGLSELLRLVMRVGWVIWTQAKRTSTLS